MAGKVPVIMQMEALECGAACLAMIAAYYGKWVAARAGACGLRRITRRIQGFQRGARGSRLRIWRPRVSVCSPGALRSQGVFPFASSTGTSATSCVPRFQGRRGASERSGTRRGDRDGGRSSMPPSRASCCASCRVPTSSPAASPGRYGSSLPRAYRARGRRARVRGHHGGGDGRRRHHQSGALPSVPGSAAGWEEPGMAVPLHCLADSRWSGAHRGRGAERHVPATSRGQDGGSVQLVVHNGRFCTCPWSSSRSAWPATYRLVRPPTPPSPHRW